MRRIYYYLEIENISPIHIGKGDNINTDLDVIRDKQGKFFIPGTSLAGSIIHSLNDKKRAIILPMLNNQNKQSPIIVGDARLIGKSESEFEIRNGIALNDDKVTIDKSKYDYEVVPSGRQFRLLIEVTDRDNRPYEDIMNYIFQSINNQDIKVGYKTTRGLGRLKINKIGKKVFDKNNINDYFKFKRYCYDHYDSVNIIEKDSKKYTIMKVSLQQRGGISIRTYNTDKGNVDYQHIVSHNKPVIPGTSWNGILRKSFKNYINMFKLDLDITDIFGNEKDDSISKKSKIYIDESIIEDGQDMIMNRVRINPFSSGSVNGALYNEKTYYNGNTELVISLDNSLDSLDTIIKILILIFVDLDQGFIAIGGQTSIGRGMFEVKEISLDNKIINVNEYIEMEVL